MQWSCLGHQSQKDNFEGLITQEGLAHAYLFSGPEMIGKRMMAEDIATALVSKGFEADILRIAPEKDEETGKVKDIPIDSIRDLKHWIYLKPLSKHKLVVIDQAERLGDEAANTLLKVLEEPPAYAHFFLITGMPNQILPTISSRCERVDFHPLSNEQMSEVLSSYNLSGDDGALLGAVASGRPGLAKYLIESKKLPEVAASIAELQKVLLASAADKIIFAKKLSDNEEVGEVVGWWLAYIHSRLTLKPHLASLAAGLIDLSFALSQSHYNRRLAIENLLLTATVPKS